MKKLLLFTLFLIGTFSFAQKKIVLNKYDYKIQTYGGIYFEIFGGHQRSIVGFEVSYKTHNFGFNSASDINYGFSIFSGVTNEKDGYEKQIAYYGFRVSNKCLSTSINVGVGQGTFYKTFYKESTLTDPVFQYTYTTTSSTVKTYHEPCIELLLKTNLTGRANGIGFILSANFNRYKTILDARCVLQLGYEWKNKKIIEP